jgi:uncharacterized protein YheU (UPF0270 family)
MSDETEPGGIELSPDQLSREALRSLIEEFVTRDGTDYGASEASLEGKIEQVRAQLASGKARLVFDPDTETANIVVPDELHPSRER